MSTEIVRCSIEGPTVEELDGIVDEKYRNKDRWVGVKCECCKEYHDRPFRKLYVDMETGRGATADDSRTLCSFDRAMEVLETDNSIQYIVYQPYDADNATEVAEMNQRLCPIQMEVLSQPTDWDLQGEESIECSDWELSENMCPVDLFGFIAEYAFDQDHAKTMLVFDEQAIISLLNEREQTPEAQCRNDWVHDKLNLAFAERNRYLISGIWCGTVLVTKESALRFGGNAEDIVYSFERLI